MSASVKARTANLVAQYCVSRSTYHRAAGVWLKASHRTDVDDMAGLALLELAHEQLRQVDEPAHVRLQHRVQVLGADLANLCGAHRQASIVHCVSAQHVPSTSTFEAHVGSRCITVSRLSVLRISSDKAA